MKVPLKDVLDSCVSCTLRGYRRAFAGEDNYFEQTSVATIIPDKLSSIHSYAFSIDSEMLKYIDEFEEYPEEYGRIEVE